MNSVLKTKQRYIDADGKISEENIEIDFELLKSFTLHEFRLLFAINRLPSINVVHDTGHDEDDERNNYPKKIKISYSELSYLFSGRNIFHKAINDLVEKDIIKKLSKGVYELNPKRFYPGEVPGTTFPNFLMEYLSYFKI